MYFEKFPPFISIAFHACFLNTIFFLMSVCRFIPIELHVKVREYPTHLQQFFLHFMEAPNFFYLSSYDMQI